MTPFDAISRANPEYVDALYRQYLADPASVEPTWALFFAGFEFARGSAAPLSAASAPAAPLAERDVSNLVQEWRHEGHMGARLDPLGLKERSTDFLDLEAFGLSTADLDRPVRSPLPGLERATLREVLAALDETYGGTFAVEYMDLPGKEQREWLRARMEPTRNRPQLDAAERRRILGQMVDAEEFELFLDRRFPGQKRFSVEGGEALIPLLDALVEEGGEHGAEHVLFGMPHRGRLNVLAHILKKPYEQILAEFDGASLPTGVQGDGDVKYHLGFSHDHTTTRGKRLHLALYPNPSHLEAINPVVTGIARAKQSFLGDVERRRVMPVLLHGDAAISGQGVVYETVAMSRLEGFTVGGTVHVIVDNQVGFTTSPADYSINNYPSDIAHFIQAPVFHVNGDDPEAAVHAARLAAGFRQAFKCDVFIHLVCFRKHGHNETDEPAFTQPKMYEVIRARPSPRHVYAHQLVARGVLTEADHEALKKATLERLDAAFNWAKSNKPKIQVNALGGRWDGFAWAGSDWSADTRYPAEKLRAIGHGLTSVPAGFEPHKNIKKLLEDRREMYDGKRGLDWGAAEALAFATLLAEGHPVRIAGQDCERGTFSHRHAVVHDVRTGQKFTPMNALGLAGQAQLEVVNSHLSEEAVVGFEYGVSSADPRRLVIWEAQFGDFANGAQVMFDQFVASAESKWQRMSGLTVFLPHGYEGQGPEHSSARLERFLQLCAEGNIQVVNATTPAQLFHVLRRQLHRPFRKPLVMMSPKSTLRLKEAASTMEQLANGRFETLIDDPRTPKNPDRILFCSGKVYWALDAEREKQDVRDVAILRVEQLYPFPADEIARALARYAGATEVFWVQEEPENQGAYAFVRNRLEVLVHQALGKGVQVGYVGRDEAASPAVGSYKLHNEEQAELVRTAFLRPLVPRMQRESLAPKSIA